MLIRTHNMALLAFTLLSSISFLSGVRAADDCQPATWINSKRRDGVFPARNERRDNATTTIPNLISTGNVTAGEVNCRYSTTIGSDVNYYTYTQLATEYGVTNDVFFTLNPTLKPDCSNIQPNTLYYVAGFIEPLRSSNGLCGPPHQNATCLGTAYQCCNSETWTCGNSTDDCAAGTCYEGACAGDKVYSTDGTCGTAHGNRLCAGKWGDCCNLNGTCGTGDAFCGISVCQMGNCTQPATGTGPGLGWTDGNSTDGTCGGTNKFTCNVVYGYCCNKDNTCGSLPSDCGVGCQPLYGKCSAVSTSPSSSSTSSSSSSSSVSGTPASTTTRTSSSTTSQGSTRTTSSVMTTPTSRTTTTPTTTKNTGCTSSIASAFSALASCGQLCINNMVAQYSALGCASPADSACLCANANFGYGIRDCSNGACGADAAAVSSAIAYGSAYCSCAGTATATATSATSTATGLAALPSCGQLCFNNVLAQYASLGCASEQDAACLCENVNFGYGLRDCSNGACGTAVASTVIAFGSSYCASATAKATAAARRL